MDAISEAIVATIRNRRARLIELAGFTGPGEVRRDEDWSSDASGQIIDGVANILAQSLQGNLEAEAMLVESVVPALIERQGLADFVETGLRFDVLFAVEVVGALPEPMRDEAAKRLALFFGRIIGAAVRGHERRA